MCHIAHLVVALPCLCPPHTKQHTRLTRRKVTDTRCAAPPPKKHLHTTITRQNARLQCAHHIRHTQVRQLGRPAYVYRQAADLMYRLAASGLVHCDFNEFNLLISEDEQLTLIDFPQMVSASHTNARELFDRDVDCVLR